MGTLTIPDLGTTTRPDPEGNVEVTRAARPDFMVEEEEIDRGRRLNAAQAAFKDFPAPDEAAQLREHARAKALPFTAALADPEAAKQEPRPLPWSEYANNAPLAEILVDPTKSVLTNDEAHRLAKLAELDKEDFSDHRLGQLWESGDLGLERDRLWTRKGMNGGLSSPEDAKRLEVIDARLSLLPQSEGFGGQILEGIVQQGPLMLGMAKSAAIGGAAGAAVGLAAGPGGAAGLGTAGAWTGVTAYNADVSIGNAYAEYAGDMKLPHEVAWPAAVIVGSAVAGVDTLSFGVLAKLPGLKAIGKLIGFDKLTAKNIRPALTAALKDSRFRALLATVGKDMAVEGSTESLQEVLQILGGYAGNTAAGGGFKTPTLEEAAARTFMSGVVGAAVGGLAGGVGTVFHETTVKVGLAEKNKATVEKLYNATENLKTADRAPDVLKEYGDKLAEQGGPVKHMTVPVEVLDQLLASVPPEQAEKYKAWLADPVVARRIETARANGTRVVLSFGDFLGYVRPLDKGRALADVVGLNDDMSFAEAKELKPAVEKARKEMRDAAKRQATVDDGPEGMIRADLEKKLGGLGKTAGAARAQSEFLAAGISTIARRTGQDAWTVYKDSGLEIVRRDFTAEEKALFEADGVKPDNVRGAFTTNTGRDASTIILAAKESLATFTHESAHYLFELMRKYESHPEIAGDMKTLREWAGVAEGAEWHTAGLEKFARGMETYIGEGRAPSAKLARAFATMKAWILHVYRVLTNLGAPLSDEVRSVMDRLLATQEEIDARRIELGYFPSEVLEREGDMTPEQIEFYRRQYEQGARQVQSALEQEAINALRKEKTAEYKRIQREVDHELLKHPVLALRAFLAGEGRVDKGVGAAPPPSLIGKLDREAVAAKKLGPGIMPKLKEYLSETAGRPGVDPDELAPYFGFKNGSEMLTALAETPARVTMKTALVNAEMTKLYPAYGPDKAWVEREALTRLHGSDAIATAIEVELATLYRKAGLVPPVSPARVAALAAREAVREMTRKEMVPAQFRDAEQRAHREAMKALAAKDFQAAAEFTRQRLYSRAMWSAVQEAAADLDAARKYALRFTSSDTLARLGRSSQMSLENGDVVGPVIRDAVKALTEAVRLAEKSEASDRTFDSYLTRLEEGGLPVAVDVDLREMPLAAWGDLSYTRALAVRDALKNLSHLAREVESVRIRDERMALDDLANKVEKSLEEAKLLGRLGKKGELKSKLRELRAEIVKPETIVIDIDGGKPGAFHDFWMGSAERGQFERDRRFRQRRDDLRKLAAENRPKGWEKEMKAKHAFVDGREYTGAEVFAMLLNFGSESNRFKLLRGMEKAGLSGWTEENVLSFIHRVFPDAAAYKYADAILKYISRDDLWKDLSDVKERISGVRPEKVPSLAIPTPDGGSIEGGYYPLVYDRRVVVNEAESLNRDALEAMVEANPMSMYAANGFTKGRTGYTAPLLLDPTALAAHLYAVDHFVANAQGIIDRHKALNNPRIKKAIVHALGYEYWQQLKFSNNFIAADGRMLSPETLQLASTTKKLLFHNALLTMGGNLLSGMNQIVSGVPATLAHLGPRALPTFTKTVLQFVKSPFQMWKEVSQMSGEIVGMDFHYDRDLRLVVARDMTGESWDHLRARVAATTMSPVVFGQKIVNVLTWKTAHSLAIAEGKSSDEAVAHANSAVRQSQSSSAPKDFTAAQRSNDTLMRVLTSLASYTFTLNDMVMPRRLTAREAASHSMRLVMLLMTSAVAKELFDLLFPLLEAEDAKNRKGIEKKAEQSEIPGLLALTEAMNDVISNVPVVGRPAESVLSGRHARFAPWYETLENAVTADYFGDKGLSKRDVRSAVEAVGLVTGIPTRHVFFAPGEFTYELMEGNVEETPWSLFQELAIVRPGHKGEK